jgi:hypothetical protein
MNNERRNRVLAAAALAVVLAGTGGCGRGGESGPVAPAAPSGALDLRGICPDPVVVQSNWFPEAEHGDVYQLVGPGYRIDGGRKRVTGPLVAEGRSTGISIEVRAGGPAIGFQSSAALMYQDPDITLGMLQSDEVIQLSRTQPVLGVVAPMERDPQILLWDPARHPDWKTIADIGRTDTKVLYFQTGTFMQYLLGSGVLHASQVDGSYDGSPSAFVASGGQIAVQGYATSEPYLYEHEVKAWAKPVAYQLVYETGYPNYANLLAVRTDRKAQLAACLQRLVPLIQRAEVAFMARPGPAIDLILKVDDAYKSGFVYTKGNAEFAVAQMRRLRIVDNGSDRTLGNFDTGRIARLAGIVGPIFAAQRKPIKADLAPSDVATNEFIDATVGLG